MHPCRPGVRHVPILEGIEVDRGVQGGLFNLDNLFVPININNSHWLFLWVDFNAHAIEIYDSIGGSSNPRNRKYMWAMRQFLYDLKFKGTPVDNRPNFEEWKAAGRRGI